MSLTNKHRMQKGYTLRFLNAAHNGKDALP